MPITPAWTVIGITNVPCMNSSSRQSNARLASPCVHEVGTRVPRNDAQRNRLKPSTERPIPVKLTAVYRNYRAQYTIMAQFKKLENTYRL